MSALASVGLTGKQPGASTTGGAIDTAATRAAESLTHSGVESRAVDVIWAVHGTARTALTEGKSSLRLTGCLELPDIPKRGSHLLLLFPPRPLPLAPPLPVGVFPEVHSWAPWELDRHVRAEDIILLAVSTMTGVESRAQRVASPIRGVLTIHDLGADIRRCVL